MANYSKIRNEYVIKFGKEITKEKLHIKFKKFVNKKMSIDIFIVIQEETVVVL